MTRRLIILFTATICWFTAYAQSTLEEAKLLVESGDLESAIPMLEELAAASPKKGEINLLLGTAKFYQGDYSGAQQQWEAALSKKENLANLKLAELALLQYRVDDAEELIETYRSGLKRGKKVLAEDVSGDIDDRIDRVTTMLARVE
ncbi:MAG: tetratricopeptide repeat protein, partial [Muribaculaceae bacterium]|nr:tetratricopeptide repeat protein [Muribaculaceae bacterium]